MQPKLSNWARKFFLTVVSGPSARSAEPGGRRFSPGKLPALAIYSLFSSIFARSGLDLVVEHMFDVASRGFVACWRVDFIARHSCRISMVDSLHGLT